MLRLIYLAYRVYCFLFRPAVVGVCVMLIREERVLLVRHTYKEGWYLPGGGVKRGETYEQAARREAFEEVGAQLEDLTLLGTFPSFSEWKDGPDAVFLSRQFTASLSHDREIAESRYFPLNALPEQLWPAHRRRLEEYQAGLKLPRSG